MLGDFNLMDLFDLVSITNIKRMFTVISDVHGRNIFLTNILKICCTASKNNIPENMLFFGLGFRQLR